MRTRRAAPARAPAAARRRRLQVALPLAAAIVVALTALGTQLLGADGGPERGDADARWQITPRELEQVRDTVRVIDVREPHEYAYSRIEGAELIPLGDLPDRLGDLDASEDIVLVCRSGERSMVALHLLRHAGFAKLRNLEGGINAYARQVDRTIPVY